MAARNRIVYITFFLSLCYLTFLASTIRTGVFYSSDGGIKYMVVKQLAEGHGFKYLYLPQPQWVHAIWDNGFFPLRPPFLYPTPEGYLFVFPPALQIISSFFYSTFGYPGLYIIPVLSTVLFWLCVVMLLRRCGLAPSRIAAGLFVLVFCSPLTIYGATYWEHMPAILLLLAGLAFVVRPPDGWGAAVAMGFISGLAAWFRPEAMMMNILYALAAVYLYVYARQRKTVVPGRTDAGRGQVGTISFLVGMGIGIGSFLLFNKIEFDSFFGVHSYQVLQDKVEEGMGHRIFNNLVMNNFISIHHYLFILLLLPALYVLAKGTRKLDIRTILLIGIALVYCVVTPLMVPNEGGKQWGARYFLPMISVVLVALLLIEKEWNLVATRQVPVWLTAIIVIFTAYSFYRNTYKGGIKDFPWENHHRISPTLNFVRQQPGNVVVVSDSYVAMELGYLFDSKYFFLAPADSGLNRLIPLLKQQGIHQYTYISDARKLDTRPMQLHDSTIDFHAATGDFDFKACIIP
jgi:hypothetical protein